MTHTQRIFAIITSVGTLLVILELVRRRKLREEYSWLWLLTAAIMVVLSSWYGLIEKLSRLVGAVTATTTLFLFGLLFLLLISVHFSTVISRLTQQVRRLTQEVALLSAGRDPALPRPQAGTGEREPGARSADANP